MLEARKLTVAFDGRVLFENLSLSIAPGERVQIAAPSGAGKTTLCRVLAGYLAPQAGKVLVDGAPLPKKGPCPVQLIGQHPERALDPRLRMEASLMEALAGQGANADEGGRRSRRARIRSPRESLSESSTALLLEALGIQSRWLARYPHELSGGEMQRFCIARALLANPRYLIADEISTMLDAVTQAQIWSVLLHQAAQRDLGLIFVSHSPALASRLATRVIPL
ncbi:ATP-binding cassette domain-containing protein [Adlercreutzia sp. R25]|uniref:ABC transporter ATP-binding protein n=1 Tax=Adlercreutzia shanghongiae TaxID=3111773 RepID=UPI002DB8A415|nr:ATP-binding cassette domain-containing protein [Adlercreutzia sp. R25]MEC4273867.1 ATP-binding cassette domain-containing protein [Adlercreutzia sp. R25]